MTDRVISYAGALPRAEDFLSVSKYAMVGDGAVAEAILGQTTQVSGLAATALSATAVAGSAFAIKIGRGFLFSYQETDPNAYGVLGTDTTTNVLKTGILSSGVNIGLTNAAPALAGQSVNCLISAQFLEQDINSTVLPYYNAAIPSQPFSGPANNSASQVTARQDTIAFQVTVGASATTGTQTTPATPAGCVPLYVVTINNGDVHTINGQIAVAPGAPFIPSIPNLPTYPSLAVFPAGSNTNSYTTVSTSYSFTAPRNGTLNFVGVAGSTANAISSSNLPSISFSEGVVGTQSIIGLGALSIVLSQVSYLAGQVVVITLTQTQPSSGLAIAVGFNAIGVSTS